MGNASKSSYRRRLPDEYEFSAPEEYLNRMGAEKKIENEYRNDFMRDRDRVLYSSAFRRMAGKTQIYLTGTDDHCRNRLTHTLEVSQIARTIAKALRLDENLTEAIALAHDLGHTPFGHAGEQRLHEIMTFNSPINNKGSITESPFRKISDREYAGSFGFKHNLQGVRVTAKLEDAYGDFGLNLTNYTLWGIAHHSNMEYRKGTFKNMSEAPDYLQCFEKYMCHGDGIHEAWSFEAFVVREADEIAQWHHDMEDALYSRAMTPKGVCSAIQNQLEPFLNDEESAELEKIKKSFEYVAAQSRVDKKVLATLSHTVVDALVTRLVLASRQNLQYLWEHYVLDDSKYKRGNAYLFFQNNCHKPMPGSNNIVIEKAIGYQVFSQTDKGIQASLRGYPSTIRTHIHHSKEVECMNAKGQYIIKKLFEAYSSHPQQLPTSVIIRFLKDIGKEEELLKAEKDGIGAVRTMFDKEIEARSEGKYDKERDICLMRNICDHIASMTDRYALKEYEKLYG
jgi:dGTPase